MNMNPSMSPQPPKRDNRVVILLSLILVLLIAAITAFVLIAIKSKDENKENPSDSQSVVASEHDYNQGTRDFPQAGADLPSIGSSSASSDTQNTATAAPNTQQPQTDSQGNPQPNPAPVVPGGTVAPGNGSQKPADGVETLEYFNTVINRVKTGASSVEQKKVENYLASSPTIPGTLNGVYKMLGGDSWLDQMLKDNSQGAATTYSGADIRAKFPVEGESYASKLTASDVRSATCTESNGIYTITITTLSDAKSTAHKHGKGHNPKAFNVTLPATVNENIPSEAESTTGESVISYPSSTITITVDAATGNVLTANYDLKWTISFTKMSADIPLGTRSEYVIKW